jgi:stage V sporulation protein B
LINVPTALALAIAMSLVPAVSSAAARGDEASVRSQSVLGLRFAFLIGLPCSAGMCLLAEPILRFVYGGSLSELNFSATADMLTVSALTIVLFTVVQATSGILQGLKKQMIPMLTLAVGVALKIILNAILIPIPTLNIHGAPLSSIVCYAVSMIPNLVYTAKYTDMRFDWKIIVIKPLTATLIMAAVVFGLNRFLPQGRLWLMIILSAAIPVYLGAAYALKAITRDDIHFLIRRHRHA